MNDPGATHEPRQLDSHGTELLTGIMMAATATTIGISKQIHAMNSMQMLRTDSEDGIYSGIMEPAGTTVGLFTTLSRAGAGARTLHSDHPTAPHWSC